MLLALLVKATLGGVPSLVLQARSANEAASKPDLSHCIPHLNCTHDELYEYPPLQEVHPGGVQPARGTSNSLCNFDLRACHWAHCCIRQNSDFRDSSP